MKSYEEVTKDVLERSEEVIKNKYRRNRRLMTAVSTSATCLVLAGALGAGIWLGSRQESNTLSDTGSELTQPAQSVSAPAATEEAVTNEAAPVPAADPFEVLDCGTDENLNRVVKLSEWKKSEDFNRYRDYFFGTWEGEFSYLTTEKYQQLIIDDSEKSYLAKKKGCWFDGFYEVNDHVLAFVYGNLEGYSLHWVDVNAPSHMYVASVKNPLVIDEVFGNKDGIATDEDVFVFSASEKKSPVYTLTKTNIVPNEPRNGFLSIFKLYETAKDYGMDIDILTDIKFTDSDDEPFYSHDLKENCYPIYLISESSDRLEFLTQLSNGFDFNEMASLFILEKINGQWTKTSVVFSECSDIPSDYHVFDECAKDYCYHTAIGSSEEYSLDSGAAPQNGTVYMSKSLKEAMNFYGDTFNDGCAVRYHINIKYYKNGELIVPTQSLFDSEMDRLEDVKQLGYDENGNYISGHFSYGWHSSDWGQTKEYSIKSGLTKLQLENFTAADEYGIALFLDDQEVESYSSPVPGAADVPADPEIDIPGNEPVHIRTVIYSYKSDNSNAYPETLPQNGTVYFTSALSNAINHYGDLDAEGYEIMYSVTIDYYTDGERFDPDENFSEYEEKRLTDLLGEMSFFGLVTSYDDDGRIKLHEIEAHLTKSQLESLTAAKDFGCAIYLRDNYSQIKDNL